MKPNENKKYIMIGNYCPNVQEKREPFREAHLDHLRQLKEQGLLEKAGPTRDLLKIFAIFCGSSESVLKKAIEEDPYWLHGIWTDYQLLEWIDAI